MALGMQSAKGTPQVTAAKLRYAQYLSGNSFEPQLDIVDLREGGDGLDFGYSYKKGQKVAGQLVVNLRPEITGQVLQGALGGATWDGGSAPALHTFHTGHASFPWMTILAQHPGSTIPHLLSDLLFTGGKIEMKSGEPWLFTAPFVAITHAATFTAVVPTYIRDEPFVYHYAPTYVLDGSADSTIDSVTIEWGLGIEELQAQQVTLDDIAVQNRDTNIEVVRRYEAATLWKKVFMGGGLAPTQSVATGAFRGAVAYGAAGAAFRQLDVEARLISYRGNGLTELDPDGKTVKETITAKVLKGATHAVFAKLSNSHASAYVS